MPEKWHQIGWALRLTEVNASIERSFVECTAPP